MTKGFRTLFTLAIPVGAAALAALYLLDFGGPRGQVVTYDTVEVTRGPIRKIVSTSGPVRALVTVSVGSQLSGQVETVTVDFNTEVDAGQLLASLDAKTFEAKAAQARADLAAARASVLNQEAVLPKAEAVLRQAERSTGRQTTLAARGFSAQSTLDTAVRDTAVAKAEIAVARAMIENAKAVVAQRQAALDQAEIDLDRTRIISPIAGTVISRSVDPGQTVAASLQAPELFKIAQNLRRIRIEAQVNEADVGALSEGNPAAFTVDAYPDRRFEGRVTQVRLAAIELNNVVTYTVIIEAANEDRRLFPGMTANVEIETARRDGELRVPNEALRFRPRGANREEANERGGAGRPGGDRATRQIDRLKSELDLTEAQETAVRAAIEAMVAEQRRKAGLGPDPDRGDRGQMRQRIGAKIETVLAPMLSDEQRPLFERWKSGRDNVRPGALWVLDAAGQPQRRGVRLGIADDQFSEIAGDRIAEGERVVLRARRAAP